jgi:methylmalonyl-CoA mutase
MSQELRIQTDFTTPTKEQWRALVDKDLKGAPFEKRLVTQLIEGFQVQPLYTSSDAPNPTSLGLPGQAPFARGSSASRSPATPWAILPEHRQADPSLANQAIVDDIEHGATGVVLRLSAKHLGNNSCCPGCGCGGGVLVDDLDALDRTLKNVDLAKTPITISTGPAFLGAAALMTALYERRGVANNAVSGGFGADPLGSLAARGNLPRRAEAMLAEAATLAFATAKKYPGVRALTVSTAAYDNAGATAVQELAAAIATSVAYLRAMEDGGLSVTDAGKQILFSLSVGADQFLEIAKFRALRVLFNRVLEAAGVAETDRKLLVHARTSRRILTQRDPWVNVLRTTIGCFAAAVGGADQITVLPFDDVIGSPDEMARRLARNTQIILQEEGNLGRVMDAAGGSYYVDNLTVTLAEMAWKEFQAIESKGGMLAVLRDGSFVKSIETVWQKRAKDLGKRKTPVTGVSEFPHLGEKKVERPAVDTKALEATILTTRETRAKDTKLQGLLGSVANATGAARFDAIVHAVAAGTTLYAVQQTLGADEEKVQAFHLNRFASAFEKLRDASDAFLAKNAKRPRIFLANMGPVAVHTARAMFSQNFFEAGGFEVLSNEGFANAAAAAETFAKSGANLAIICSSDAWYETGAAEVAKALKQKQAGRVLLAGNPGQNEASYREAGVDQFIFIGCDVLGMLTELAQYEKVVS